MAGTVTRLQRNYGISTDSNLSTWYNELPLRFGLCSRKVAVFTEPSEMYQQLMTGISSATERIVLSSLYLGNGAMETDLVSTLDRALANSTTLKAHLLLDYTRGSRGGQANKSSRSLLLPCKRAHSDRIIVSLYHTPNLRGVMKKVLPDRFNELLGLQHMKIYIFDDTVMLSGANMSQDYFTNRQDRYIVIRDCPALADFFSKLVDVVSQFSYQMDESNTAQLNEACQGSPVEDVETFCSFAERQVKSFLSHYSDQDEEESASADTWIYPLVQMGSFNVSDDYRALAKFFSMAAEGDQVFLSTAYFNPLEEYVKRIAEQSVADYHILAASPQVNGFFGASGIAGYIPNAYSWYEKRFLAYINQIGCGERVLLQEYTRPDWTFHAKGLWYYQNGAELPNMTMIGSSNFGYRSVHLDLEAQVVLHTESEQLQQRLHEEKMNIFNRSQTITQKSLHQRHLPIWTGLIALGSRHYF